MRDVGSFERGDFLGVEFDVERGDGLFDMLLAFFITVHALLNAADAPPVQHLSTVFNHVSNVWTAAMVRAMRSSRVQPSWSTLLFDPTPLEVSCADMQG